MSREGPFLYYIVVQSAILLIKRLLHIIIESQMAVIES